MEKRTIKLNKRTAENNTHSNIVDDSIIDISAWRVDSKKFKTALFFYILSFGILYLICSIYKRIYIKFNCVSCDPLNADYFIIEDEDKEIHVIPSKKENFIAKHPSLENYNYKIPSKKKLAHSSYIGNEFFNFREEFTVLIFRLNKYCYIESEGQFVPVKLDLSRFKNQEIHEKFSQGIRSIEEYNYLLNKFGLNSFEMEEKTFLRIVRQNFFSPLYMYQIYSIVIWILIEYYYFTAIVLICNIIILFISSYYYYQNHKRITKLNRFIQANVKRDFEMITESREENSVQNSKNNSHQNSKNSNNTVNFAENNSESLQIVPGDIIQISSGEIVPCDCLIIDGVCTVNESDLTGESTLVMKSVLSNDIKNFSYENNKKSFLYHGTTVVKCESTTNDGIMTVIAINTGFNTNRGNLFQNLLFPKPTNFKFFNDIKQFFIIMFIIWVISSFFIIIIYYSLPEPKSTKIELIKYILDLLTVVLPPTMNLCLSFISYYFHFTLNNKNISCVSDKRMNAAGRVNIVVLDKTGTLTEEGLEIYGFQTTMVKNFNNHDPTKNPKKYLDFDKIEKNTKIYHSVHKEFWKKFCCYPESPLFKNYQKNLQFNLIFYLECLATCHSIDKLKDDYLGNSLDKTIFDSIQWIQEKCINDENENEINNLNSIDYNSNERMSNLDSEFQSSVHREALSTKTLPHVNQKYTKDLKYDMIPKNSYKITEESIFRHFNNPFSGRRYKLTIVKRFEFSSKFQSMSVIVKNCLDDSYRFFIKGAPEKILQSCQPETLPHDFNEKLLEHTKNGFRVIACATKLLSESSEDMSLIDEDRTSYENNLTFLGLIIFKNKLKRDTKKVIINLKSSDLKLVIATGDNPFTSIAVARECELLENDKNVFLFDMDKLGNSKLKITPLIVDEEVEKIFRSESKRFKSSTLKLSKKILNKKSIVAQNDAMSHISDFNSNKSVISSERKLLFSEKDEKSLNSLKMREMTDFSIINNARDFYYNIKKIIDSDAYICISGKALDYLLTNYKKEISKVLTTTIFTDLLRLVERNGKIFFRMNPYNKVDLINLFKENKSNIVAMCGDGANDCGALLSSDVGITIRKHDKNNFVSSHFFSNDESISCIELIIRNGRACFENSVITLKFMILYAVIQLTSVIIFYSNNYIYENGQYLYVDCFIVLITCLLATKTGAAYELNPIRPSYSLIEKSFIISIIGNSFIQIFMQILFYNIFKIYRSKSFTPELNTFKSYFYLFSVFQYLSCIYTLNFFSQHRKSFYANKIYICYLSIILFFSFSQLTNTDLIYSVVKLEPHNYLYDLESEKNRLFTLLMVVANLTITMIFETLVNKCCTK